MNSACKKTIPFSFDYIYIVILKTRNECLENSIKHILHAHTLTHLMYAHIFGVCVCPRLRMDHRISTAQNEHCSITILLELCTKLNWKKKKRVQWNEFHLNYAQWARCRSSCSASPKFQQANKRPHIHPHAAQMVNPIPSSLIELNFVSAQLQINHMRPIHRKTTRSQSAFTSCDIHIFDSTAFSFFTLKCRDNEFQTSWFLHFMCQKIVARTIYCRLCICSYFGIPSIQFNSIPFHSNTIFRALMKVSGEFKTCSIPLLTVCQNECQEKRTKNER